MHGPIMNCLSCGLPVPLRVSNPDERPINFVCSDCGAGYTALIDERSSPDLLGNVRPALFPIDRMRLTHPLEAIEGFVDELVGAPYQGPERRASKRHSVSMPVAALAIDSQFRSLGEPFIGLCRNISAEGIALMHSHAVDTDFLALDFTAPGGKRIQMVMRVLRCRAVGPYYEIAGPFLTDVDA